MSGSKATALYQSCNLLVFILKP